jgi:hypothetical protein
VVTRAEIRDRAVQCARTALQKLGVATEKLFRNVSFRYADDSPFVLEN